MMYMYLQSNKIEYKMPRNGQKESKSELLVLVLPAQRKRQTIGTVISQLRACVSYRKYLNDQLRNGDTIHVHAMKRLV